MICETDFMMDIAKYIVERTAKDLGIRDARVYDDGQEVFIKTGKNIYSFSPLEFVKYHDIKEALDNIYTRRASDVLDILNNMKGKK